jgi:hypothetical protein
MIPFGPKNARSRPTTMGASADVPSALARKGGGLALPMHPPWPLWAMTNGLMRLPVLTQCWPARAYREGSEGF